MNTISKTDFMALISVNGANPNGDPLCGGRPRTDINGNGLITNVCIKRKLRDRLEEMGEDILVSPPRFVKDSINHRMIRLKCSAPSELYTAACGKWFDVRAFGQVFALPRRSGTVDIRGPVIIQHSLSLHPVEIIDMPITRCIGASKGKDHGTIGFSSIVRFGLYAVKGTICAAIAEKTGFDRTDAEKLKYALCHIFDNDTSNARPDGSMILQRLYWWEHSSASRTPSAAVYNSVKIRLKDGCVTPRCFEDYIIDEQPPEGLSPEIYVFGRPMDVLLK